MFRRRKRSRSDFSSELQSHLAFETDRLRAEGLSEEAAHAEARKSFGNVTRSEEQFYESSRPLWFDSLLSDFAYATRVLRKSPVFVLAAALTLALGIGANTAIFTVIRAVLLKPLDYSDPDRLVRISADNSRQNYRDVGFTLIRFQQMKAAAKSFSDLGAYFIATEHMTLSGAAEPEQVTVGRVSANFLHILGVEPLLGRTFLPEEDQRGGHNTAMISAQLWKRRFGGDPRITTKTIDLNATPYTLVGVLPEDFQFPAPDLDVWVPRPAEYSEMAPQVWNRLTVLIGLGRLKPGVTLDQARAELSVLNHQYTLAHPELADAAPGVSMRVVLLRDQLVANVRPMLWTLFGAVGFVLIIACANVASLLLARAISRSREFAVRAALGAGRGRLIRQLLAESLLLALAGGTLGMLLAKWSLTSIRHLSSFHLPRAGEIHLDGTVLAFTIVLSMATGVFFGLIPSFQASRPGLGDLLRERADGGGQASARQRILGVSSRSLLVVGQVALSVILLIGAALLMESFARLHSVNPGFNPGHLLTMRIDLPPARYDTPQKTEAFFKELLQRLDAVPGVRSAAAALTLPMSPLHAVAVQVQEQPTLPLTERPSVVLQSVTPGYFQTAGIPLEEGRVFTDRDNVNGARLTVIINESFARRFWPDYPRGRDPIGQHIFVGSNPANIFQITGITGDVHERGFATEAAPELYLPYHFYPLQTAGVLVRTNGDPQHFINAIRRQVWATDSDQSAGAIRTMDELLDSSVGQQRLTLLLLAGFAGMALLLAAVGMYGLIAYSVVQRTQELGIRRALGAQRLDILRLVVGHGLFLTIAGVGLGILGAFELTRVMSGLLFRVSRTDPTAFAGVALLFLLVALAASYIPAWRATRVDPMAVLR